MQVQVQVGVQAGRFGRTYGARLEAYVVHVLLSVRHLNCTDFVEHRG